MPLKENGGIAAVLIEGAEQRAARVAIGDYTISLARPGIGAAGGARVGVLFLPIGPDEFLVVGAGDAVLTFSTDKPGLPMVGVESIDEEFYENHAWTPRRRLNGDESSHGQVLRISSSDLIDGRIYRVRLYRYR